jgi:hypothetical protein
VFFDSGADLRVATATGNTWGVPVVIPGTDASDGQPAAVRGTDGTIYLFYTRPVAGSDNEIILRRRSPVTGEWSPAQQVTRHTANDQRPYPVLAGNSGVWLLFMSNRTGNFDIYARQIITAI